MKNDKAVEIKQITIEMIKYDSSTVRIIFRSSVIPVGGPVECLTGKEQSL